MLNQPRSHTEAEAATRCSTLYPPYTHMAPITACDYSMEVDGTFENGDLKRRQTTLPWTFRASNFQAQTFTINQWHNLPGTPTKPWTVDITTRTPWVSGGITAMSLLPSKQCTGWAGVKLIGCNETPIARARE